MLLTSSLVVATKEQVSSSINEDTVILNIKSGVYYSLNNVGSSIWNLIQQPKTIEEIRESLINEYEVDSTQCDREVLALLQELESVGLIEVSNEAIA